MTKNCVVFYRIPRSFLLVIHLYQGQKTLCCCLRCPCGIAQILYCFKQIVRHLDGICHVQVVHENVSESDQNVNRKFLRVHCQDIRCLANSDLDWFQWFLCRHLDRLHCVNKTVRLPIGRDLMFWSLVAPHEQSLVVFFL